MEDATRVNELLRLVSSYRVCCWELHRILLEVHPYAAYALCISYMIYFYFMSVIMEMKVVYLCW